MKKLILVALGLVVVLGIAVLTKGTNIQTLLNFHMNQTATTSASPNTNSNNNDSKHTNEVVVQVNDLGFIPPIVIVKSGTKITWMNKSGKIIQIKGTTQNASLIDITQLKNNQDASIQLTNTGTYMYQNTHNTSQNGGIIVIE